MCPAEAGVLSADGTPCLERISVDMQDEPAVGCMVKEQRHAVVLISTKRCGHRVLPCELLPATAAFSQLKGGLLGG